MPSKGKRSESPERIGRYQVLRKIATGGMAELFLAKQVGMEGFEKVVAIKRILSHLGHDEEFINMFRDEARIVAKLSHPNIVQIYDLGKSNDTYFIAMEYIPGRNLSSVAKRAKSLGLRLPAVYIARCMAQACDGLHYAHTRKDLDGQPLNIVHRDVSPQNIIVGFSGQVKLVDFGIAKAATKIAHTRAGVLKGKYAYMSPEQIRGEEIDARSDLFAVGIVLYELLAGRRPFEKENSIQTLKAIVQDQQTDPRELNPDIPVGMVEIIQKALSKKRDERYATAQEIQIALEDFVASGTERANNIVVSQWLSSLFADELSKGKGSTMVFKDVGEVILPDTDKAGAKKAKRTSDEPPPDKPKPVEASSRKPSEPKRRAKTPAAPSVAKERLSNSSVDDASKQPIVLKRGRGGGSVEARPPIQAPSTRMPERRNSSVNVSRRQLIEEGVIDGESPPPDPSFSDDATTIAPPNFPLSRPSSEVATGASPIPKAQTDSSLRSLYEEGERDAANAPDKPLYDDSKTEFAPQAPDHLPDLGIAGKLTKPARPAILDSAIGAPDTEPPPDSSGLSLEINLDDNSGSFGWSEETAATNSSVSADTAAVKAVVVGDDTTGIQADALGRKVSPAGDAMRKALGLSRAPGRRPSPKSLADAAKKPASAPPSSNRSDTEAPVAADTLGPDRDTEAPPREVSIELLPGGPTASWADEPPDTGAPLEEPEMASPHRVDVDVDADSRTIASSDYDALAGGTPDVATLGMPALTSSPAMPVAIDLDDEETMRPNDPVAAFEAELDELAQQAIEDMRPATPIPLKPKKLSVKAKGAPPPPPEKSVVKPSRPPPPAPRDFSEPAAPRGHLHAEGIKPPRDEMSAIALPGRKKSSEINSTEQESPLPPGSSGRDLFAPKAPKPIGPANPLASIGSTKVPPANVSLSEMLVDPRNGKSAPDTGMPVAGAKRPAARSSSRSSSIVSVPLNRNIKESIRPSTKARGATLDPTGAVAPSQDGGPPHGSALLNGIGTPVGAKPPAGPPPVPVPIGAIVQPVTSSPGSPAPFAPQSQAAQALAAPLPTPSAFGMPQAPAAAGVGKRLQIILIALCFVALAAVVTVVLYKTRGPTLEISTTPTGARIFLNDKLLAGETPLKVRGIAGGQTYRVRIVAAGHEQQIRLVPIPPDATTSKVHFQLEAAAEGATPAAGATPGAQ